MKVNCMIHDLLQPFSENIQLIFLHNARNVESMRYIGVDSRKYRVAITLDPNGIGFVFAKP